MSENEISPPVLVSFAITRRCNLACPHCYSDSASSADSDLPLAAVQRVIGEIAASGARLLILDGGEPTVRPDLVEIVAHARSCGLRPLLGSNATEIDYELACRLKAAGLEMVAVSLDGAEAATHDGFRGLPGAFRRSLDGMGFLQQAGIPFQVAPCVTQHNFNDWDAIVDLAERLGAPAVETFDFVPSGRAGSHQEQYALTTCQRRDLVRRVLDRAVNGDTVHRVIGIPQYWVEAERSLPEETLMTKVVRACCGAGIRYACIMPDGIVYPCMVLPVPAGDVRRQSFTDIWRSSPVFNILRDQTALEGRCGSCRYQRVCRGARCHAYAATGRLMASDPLCWIDLEEVDHE